jgi:hypothetical protein
MAYQCTNKQGARADTTHKAHFKRCTGYVNKSDAILALSILFLFETSFFKRGQISVSWACFRAVFSPGTPGAKGA